MVRALTGINTDRLSEEKKRGITIDIGFAHMIMGDYRIGFIDVPGHERFVKNMLSGIGGIRLLLLVIAADESVMPQTIEHLQICNLLGIPGGIIVITRIGLAEEEIIDLVEEEAREACRGTFLENAPVVRVDSISGEGMEGLKLEIARQIQKLEGEDRSPQQKSRQVTRLPIDRVFTLKGFGTVVTGTLLSGSLKQDDQVSPYPAQQAGEIYKVRSIEVFNRKEAEAVTGQRTAVNLAGASREELCRGMILSVPVKMKAASSIDAEICIHPESPVPLQHRMPVRLHHGSGESIARVYLMNEKTIGPGEKGLAQVRLKKAILGFPGDRFILRRYSPAITIGGGIILQNEPSRHRRKDLVRLLPKLETLARSLASPDENTLVIMVNFLLEEKSVSGTTISSLAARTGENEASLKEALRSTSSTVMISDDQVHLACRASLEKAASRTLEFLEEHHARHPLSGGVPRQELYERFFSGLAPALFQKLLSEMESGSQIAVRGALVSTYGYHPEMSSGHQEIRKNIEALFQKPLPGLDSPGMKTVLGLPGLGKEGKDVFYHMLSSGELLKISEDLVVTAEQLTNLVATMRKAFPPGRPFQIPAFKELFDISRKHAIPLLEFLDQKGITSRRGNDRIVKEG